MAAYADLYGQVGATKIGEILESFSAQDGCWHDGSHVCILGIVSSITDKVTKNNSTMAFVTLEDFYGSIEILVFPQALTRFSMLLEEGKVLCVTGKLSAREDEDPKLLCDEIRSAEALKNQAQPSSRKAASGKQVEPGLYLKVKDQADPGYLRAKKYMAIFNGHTQLYVAFMKERKLFRAPASQGVDVNDVLLRELRKVLGEKNVAFVT
jgi:DNA polymerase-3 subunit alpha